MLSSEQMRDIAVYHGEMAGDGIHIDAEFGQEEGEDVVVTTHIIARGKGDKALELLGDDLQRLANKYGVTFVHWGAPIDPADAAEKLFSRTEGYEKIGKGEDYTWQKSFSPVK